MSSISRFHIQIIQLFAFVFVWVHWDACLQYGACTSQPPSRYTQPAWLCLGNIGLSTGWDARGSCVYILSSVGTSHPEQKADVGLLEAQRASLCSAAAAAGCMQAG